MEKTARAELIAALITDKFSGFKEGDESILESAADARLEEFRTASEQRQSTAKELVRLETDNRNVSARLKVAEDRLRAAEQPMTKDEFLQKAPAEFKTLLENQKAIEEATKSALVASLKDCGANSEDELKKMSVQELTNLAKYARVQIPDFSGRGVAVHRAASDPNVTTNYVPPDSYAAATTKKPTVN